MQKAQCYGEVNDDIYYMSSVMKKFMQIQRKKIEVDKWNEGCRIQTDPGHKYVLSWVETKADWFRAAWENSRCKDCILCEQCGYFVLNDCERFEPNLGND